MWVARSNAYTSSTRQYPTSAISFRENWEWSPEMIVPRWRSKAMLVNVRERDLLGSLYEPVNRTESQTYQSAMSQILTLSSDGETVE